MKKFFEFLKESLRINAIVRLFKFVEVKKSEIAGLVIFAVIFATLEGIGISFLMPILQYAESGQSALDNSSSAMWHILSNVLGILHLKPTLIVLLLMAFLPILLRNVLFYLKTWYSSVVSSKIMLRLRMKVVDRVYHADPEFFSRHPVGQLVGVVMSQTATAGGAVLFVINLFGIIMLMLVYISILLMLSVPLTAVALGFALIVALINRAVLNWIRDNSLKNARLSQELMAKVVERMGQMRLVKLRDTKAFESGYILDISEIMRTLSIKMSKVSAAVEVIVDPILMLSVFVTLYIGIAVLGSTLAQLGLLLYILTRLNAKVKEFNGGLQAISSSAAGVRLVQEMFEAAEQANTIRSGAITFEGLSQGIEFKDVTFEYPDVYSAEGKLISNGKKVIKGVNAHIKVGSFTALVGRSGAGKSTLVELIPRMRDITSGAIVFDEHDIKDFKVGTLRKGIGYVTQSPMLFNESIRSNLTYGLDFEPTEEDIRRALEQAYATFVYDLPEGLETRLGDRGVRFSGGERQRIAMARVLLEDTDILVFDEPTSALDSESESYIQKTLNEIRGKKTLIVIAHRLATIVSADQLLVVEDGKIVEEGTHAELLARQGHYAHLFKSQLIGDGKTH